MIQVTSEANQAIKNIMEEKSLSGVVRIFLQQGCSGSQLGLGTDEAKESDLSVEVDGLTYVVDRELSETTGELKVDFVNDEYAQGFAITPEKPLPQGDGCSSCGSSCSC